MSAIFSFLILGVISQTFSQDLFQSIARLNIPQPHRAAGLKNSPITDNDDSQLEETDLNTHIITKFAAYNLHVSKLDGICPILFDVSLSPDEVRENFYNEAVYFALDNGLYEVGDLPQRLAVAAAQAFPNLTPLEFFKVTSNTLQLIMQRAGIVTEDNYQVLDRLNAKSIEDAMDSVKVKDSQSALHAIIVGAGVFLRSLSINSPEEIRYALATYADQFSRVPTTGDFQ
ncbi:uncharacterized protein [Parasteatoda tepidariorum]|uniref:uncharacterized protein n=1 Tax=Parasteatoda tepidariorum TaxID=114398 RepID=UPI0039BCAED1